MGVATTVEILKQVVHIIVRVEADLQELGEY